VSSPHAMAGPITVALSERTRGGQGAAGRQESPRSQAGEPAGHADPGVVGAKAARLARAAVAGLPVPGSLVVPCTVSEPVLAAAMRQADAASVHHGRLVVMTAGRSRLAGLEHEVSRLGAALAVRSSSPAEDDPRLAGAFSSLIGVPPADVATAVLSVWASAIHGRRPGVTPADCAGSMPRMAVLIQPEIRAQFAGTAEVQPDRSVIVVVTDGPAAPLMAGWTRGMTVQVDPAGEMSSPDDLRCDRSVLLATASMARDVADKLGDSLIEWAWADGCLWLLQSRSASGPAGEAPARYAQPAGGPSAARPRGVATGPVRPWTGRSGHATSPPGPATVLVLRAMGLSGALGERWLLPWQVAPEGALELGWPPARGSAPETIPGDPLPQPRLGSPAQSEPDPGAEAAEPDAVSLWRHFTVVADQLTAQAWGVAPARCDELARQLRAALRRGATPRELAARPLCAPDPALVERARALIIRLTAHLRHRGVIRSVREFCALPADLVPVLRGARTVDARRRAYLAALSWEPALYGAAVLAGRRLAGRAAASGSGCGPCLPAEEAAVLAGSGTGLAPPRPVIVASYPLPWYAPLLMGAAGLVTRGGSSAAHLIGVARSLGVPAVTSCDLPAWLITPSSAPSRAMGGQPLASGRLSRALVSTERPVAAVDGEAGTVYLLSARGRLYIMQSISCRRPGRAASTALAVR
jgi:PEP-utilising enzyme, mobile domain